MLTVLSLSFIHFLEQNSDSLFPKPNNYKVTKALHNHVLPKSSMLKEDDFPLSISF